MSLNRLSRGGPVCFPLRELEVFCRLPVLIVFSARSLASVPSNGVSSSDMGLGREGEGGGGGGGTEKV